MNKVLVIGGGGREHAIVHALSQSSQVDKIYAAPGNAGMAHVAQCVNIKDTQIDELLEFAKAEGITLTVVGPEASLALGIVDRFVAAGLNIFGPTQAATRVESSKEYAKELMKKYGIPTADYQVFCDFDKANEYIHSHSLPVVLKYDGLAAGKGVVVAETIEQAENALEDMLLDQKFGKGRVVVEEFLKGPEFSFMCFVSDENVYPMVVAQDHKRAFDGDRGPNTGGMGAYSPVPFISQKDIEWSLNNIMKPMAIAMVTEGTPFRGVLYGGLMKTPEGIKVIEFNARFGDPETEVVLPRLKSDLYQILFNVAKGLPNGDIKWDNRAAIGVVLASNGYPGSYEKGYPISGIGAVNGQVFHMGTAVKDGKIITNGGRVLFVTILGDDLVEAQRKANIEVAKIKCDNLFHRTDIGWQAIKEIAQNK